MKLTQCFNRTTLLVILFFVVSCVTHRDGAPANANINHSKVSNVVPKNEPLSRYGNPKSYKVLGETYYPLKSSKGYVKKGIASWYGTKFHGKKTSSGEKYDMYAMTAAHKTLPLPSYVNVKNLENGKEIIVKVNDRGPFHEGRIIDLSYVAALKLGVVKSGTANVQVTAIDIGHQEAANELPVYIQVGAFSDKQNAEKLQLKLAKADINSDIHPYVINARRHMYRVRIGPLTEAKQAGKYMQWLADIGVKSAKILTEK